MRILHLYKDYYPVVGGIENHVRWLAEAQVQAGHEVTALVCNRGSRTTTELCNGVRVMKAGRLATVASMPLSVAYVRLLAQLRTDIAHLHAPFPLGAVANRWFGRARATVITHHSDIVRQKLLLRLYAPLLRRVLQGADAIIATSPPYLAHSPWLRPHQARCTVVPLGIPTAPGAPPAAPEASVPPTVLFVGRLRYYKGLDTLIRAMGAVPEARLRIVGDGPMRAAWQRLATDLGLQPRIAFTGDVPDADLPEIYRTASLFVLPANARSEAFGLVLLEAMAAGLPVISTELGTGTSWVNQDGRTGYVVPPQDVDALARAIRTLLSDSALRRRMGQAARDRVLTEFALERMAERVEQVYHRALSSG